MSVRGFAVWMTIVGVVWIIALTVAVVALGARGEDTRQAVVISSACTRATAANARPADVAACVEASRVALKNRPLQDDCIIQRRTLKTRWFETITRCPPNPQFPPATGGR